MPVWCMCTQRIVRLIAKMPDYVTLNIACVLCSTPSQCNPTKLPPAPLLLVPSASPNRAKTLYSSCLQPLGFEDTAVLPEGLCHAAGSRPEFDTDKFGP